MFLRMVPLAWARSPAVWKVDEQGGGWPSCFILLHKSPAATKAERGREGRRELVLPATNEPRGAQH